VYIGRTICVKTNLFNYFCQMKVLIIFAFFIHSFSFAQTEGYKICMEIKNNNFSTDKDAENALTKIINASGLSKNFILIPCDDIENALALSYKGVRYILYDRGFMKEISLHTNSWTNLTILAHEVGHHLNGHSIDLIIYSKKILDAPTLSKSRKQELEADEFAGFIMAKLGAELYQVTESISFVSSEGDDTYSTHPNKSKRISAVTTGFNKAKIQMNKSNSSNNNNSKNGIKNVEKPFFDGIYQYEDDENSRSYIRFYPDGTVINVVSSGYIEEVTGWFTKENCNNCSFGKYVINEGDISFITKQTGSRGVRYNGSLNDGYKLKLYSKSLINGKEFYHEYDFIGLK